LVGGWDPCSGHGEKHCLSDVWTLDIDTWEWNLEPVALPWGPMSRFQMVEIRGKIYIHSYKNRYKLLGIDPETKETFVQETRNLNARLEPPVRWSHSMTKALVPVRDEAGNKIPGQFEERLFVFGGTGVKGKLPEDVWTLSTRTWLWKRVRTRYDMPLECAKLEGVRRAILEEAEDGQLDIDEEAAGRLF